jgi:hypothetical protein
MRSLFPALKIGSVSKSALVAATMALSFGAATNSALAAVYPESFGSDNWGIPGVGDGITPYLGSVPVYGFEVSFANVGAPIDSSSIPLGNNCGNSPGGTLFCTISPTNIWKAFQTGPDSIEFLAQNASSALQPDQLFFVNVFFTSAPSETATATFAFIDPTPLPAALPLFSGGLGLIGWLLQRRKRKAAALAAA